MRESNLKPLLSVDVDGGKYTVIQHQDGRTEARRYGDSWRDITGDGLMLAMAYELAELREWREKTFCAHRNIDMNIDINT